jgi:hypothetical protein
MIMKKSMEQSKNIRNDALVEAYRALHKNNNQQTQQAVTEQMIKTTFLLPVEPVKGKMPEDLPPRVLKNEKGQFYLPLFTDILKIQTSLQDALLPVDISDAYGYLVENKALQGVIVNAFSQPNLICPRPMVETLAKLWGRVKTAELNGENLYPAPQPQPQSVRLLVPRQYPDGVTFSLSAGLRTQPDISRAWMCMIQKNPEEKAENRDWMVILENAEPLKGREESFRYIGKSVSVFLNNHNVIFTELSDKFSALTEHARPIYQREEVEAFPPG